MTGLQQVGRSFQPMSTAEMRQLESAVYQESGDGRLSGSKVPILRFTVL